jgi:hypothetical protein
VHFHTHELKKSQFKVVSSTPGAKKNKDRGNCQAGNINEKTLVILMKKLVMNVQKKE